MFTSIWEDIKREFNYGNTVSRIILVNIGVFLLINIVWVILRISNGWVTPPAYEKIVQFLSISSSVRHNLTHIWVFITHMFLHEGFFHLFFNMLMLYYFGRIVGDFIGNHRVLPLYLLSGIAGALMFFLTVNFLPYGGGNLHFALGASAAVMGIVLAAGVLSPDYIFYLPLLGAVKIKYIIAVMLIVDFFAVAGNTNTGGHFAHLGGALFGWIFVRQLRKGQDLSVWVNRLIYSITLLFKPDSRKQERKGPYMVYKNQDKKKTATRKQEKSKPHHTSDNLSHEEQVDSILDKIKEKGYESLTPEEKEFLFNASKK
ncbi:MAG: rhomboid family intramembrane serine protease [Saprospiraceae bacterium]|nr:rhomboid family intramembrane serine protease [Saprospiraceae bacterium]MCB9324306.1 rhomboid family intramembrane serine protease [Lewinellaceae bacterium]